MLTKIQYMVLVEVPTPVLWLFPNITQVSKWVFNARNVIKEPVSYWPGVFKVWDCGPPLRQILEKGNTSTPSTPLVYFLSFTQFLDACGIMIIFSDSIDTQQLSQDSLILLFDWTKYMKRSVWGSLLVSETVKFPRPTMSLNYLCNQITHI